jgi:hypothetical protein
MQKESRDWMTYIDTEIRAVCEAKGWGHQIRRKWSVREKPVSESPAEDYEWKLIPGARGKLPDASSRDFEGTYYVLSFDRLNGKFIFQHDTSHCGMWGPHMETATYTEITPDPFRTCSKHGELGSAYPPAGWLRKQLDRLTAQFAPNHFSRT